MPALDPSAWPGAPSASALRRWVLVCIAVTGGLTMVYELVWIRMVGFIFGSSSQSFSVMLVTFLAGIALGGAVAHRLFRAGYLTSRRSLVTLFGACEVAVAASVLLMLPFYERLPYIFAQARTLFASTDGGYLAMQLVQVVLLGAVMLVPTTLVGVTLPLASRVVVVGVGDVGSGVGASFSSNTLGTLMGAAFTGLVLIPALGIQVALLGAIAASAVVGGALLVIAGRRRVAAVCVALIGATLVVIVLAGGAWNPVLMTAGYFRGKTAPVSFEAMQERYAGHKLLFSQDGHDSTVTVVDVEGDVFLKVNGKTDASTLREDMVTQTISGHLPILLHPGDPEEVLVIGLGSGVTAGATLAHPGTTTTSVELSQAVVDGARHFNPQNHDVLGNPRHTMLVADAKDYVHLTSRTFDVVVSEPSNPWISGVASLFTAEFFGAIHGVMSQDGVYLQWLQMYAFTDEAFARSVRTLRSVFPHVTVWRFTRADCLLVASKAPLSTAHLARRMAQVSAEFGPTSPLPLGSPAQLLAHQVLSSDAVTAAFAPRPPLNRDEAPFLEFEAPRAMFRRTKPAILDDLDERKDPGAASRLLVASVPSVPPEKLALALARSGHGTLAERVTGAAQLDAAVTDAELDAGHAAGDPVPSLLRALDTATAPTASQCRGWSGRLAALAIESRNALYAPPLGRLRRFTTLCARLHPDLAGTLRTYLGKALYATGRTQEAAPLLAEP
jgi:spermidine synthase